MKIAIEANIGAGKTTLMKHMFERDRISVLQEPVGDWKFLPKFYEDPSRWGFTFNLEVLMTFEQWRDISFDVFIERSPMSCRHVFTQLQYENNDITIDELKLFDKFYNKLAWKPDAIIYINTDPNVCYQRMKTRGRECESLVPLEYLQAVHKKYDIMINQIAKSQGIKVYTIDGNQSAEDVYKSFKELHIFKNK